MSGTIAYAALVTVGLGLLLFAATRRRVSAWLAWPLGLALSWGVELWQLTGVPARLSSQWIGWRLTLGTTFDWRDVALYPVGVALAALALWAVPALRSGATPPAGSAGPTSRVVTAWAGSALFLSGMFPLCWWVPLSLREFTDAYDGASGAAATASAEAALALAAATLLGAGLWMASRPPGTTPPQSCPQVLAVRAVCALAVVVSSLLFFGFVAWIWAGWLVPLAFLILMCVFARLRSATSVAPRGAWWMAGATALMVGLATVVVGALLALVWASAEEDAGGGWWVIPSSLAVIVVLGGVLGLGVAVLTELGIDAAPPVLAGSAASPAHAAAPTRAARPTWTGAALAAPLVVTIALLGAESIGAAIAESDSYLEWVQNSPLTAPPAG